MDPEGKERWRLEGYRSRDDFWAWLQMGLARLALFRKDWADAERRFDEVIEKHPNSAFAPQAVYYRGVSRYSASHDGAELGSTAKTLSEKHSGTEWHQRSLPWAG